MARRRGSVVDPQPVIEDRDFTDDQEVLSSLAALHERHQVRLALAAAGVSGCLRLAAQPGDDAPDRRGGAVLGGQVRDLGHGAAAAAPAADGEIPAVEVAEAGERDGRFVGMTLGHLGRLNVLVMFGYLIRHPGGPALKDGAAGRRSGGPEGARNARVSRLQHERGPGGVHAERADPCGPARYGGAMAQ